MRSWKKHRKAVMSEALPKYSPKQIASSKIQRITYNFRCRLLVVGIVALFLVLPIIKYSMHPPRFLDKACINHGKEGAWSLCSMTKVEETKIVLRMLCLSAP